MRKKRRRKRKIKISKRQFIINLITWFGIIIGGWLLSYFMYWVSNEW